MAFIPKNVMNKVEGISERVFKNCNGYLLMASRLCLISTFIEDGLRMYFLWPEQRKFVNISWSFGTFLSTVFILVHLVGQLGGCILILLQKRVKLACGILFFIFVLQTAVYIYISTYILPDIHFVLKMWVSIGALLLILADSEVESNPLLAGIPSLGVNKQKNYMQLTGRCLIAFMFITLLKFDLTFGQFVQDFLGTVMMVFVFIGYKTKLSALVLVLLLTYSNFYYNAWWKVQETSHLRDFLKYIFFQTFSVIGGLLLIVLRGPGAMSIDEHKKNW